jgi:hypothetical protein
MQGHGTPSIGVNVWSEVRVQPVACATAAGSQPSPQSVHG